VGKYKKRTSGAKLSRRLTLIHSAGSTWKLGIFVTAMQINCATVRTVTCWASFQLHIRNMSCNTATKQLTSNASSNPTTWSSHRPQVVLVLVSAKRASALGTASNMKFACSIDVEFITLDQSSDRILQLSLKANPV